MYLKKALRGTIMVLMLSLLGGLFGYLLRILLARKLTIEEFGLFYSIITVFLFISYFVEVGMGQAISRRIIELDLNKKSKRINDLIFSVMMVQLAISIMLAALIMIFAGFLSKNFFHADSFSMMLLLSIWLITSPLIGIFLYTFYGFKKSSLFSFFDMLKYFLLLVISFIGLYFGIGIYSPVWAYVLTNCVLIIIGLIFIKKVFPQFSFRFKFNKQYTLEMFKFGSMVFISNLSWLVITQVDTMAVTYFTDPMHVGLYQIAVPLAAMLLYITNAVSLVIYPIATELHARKDYAKLIEGLGLVYKYLLIIVVPLAIIIFSFPEVIITMLFTSQYLDAAPVLQVLSIATIFFSLCIINNNILVALGKPGTVAKTMLFIALLNLTLNILFIPRYGIFGAAIATGISFVIGAILSTMQIHRETRVVIPYRTWFLVAIVGVLMIFLINYLRIMPVHNIYIKTGIISLLALISYSLVLILLRIIRFSEMAEYKRILFKK